MTPPLTPASSSSTSTDERTSTSPPEPSSPTDRYGLVSAPMDLVSNGGANVVFGKTAGGNASANFNMSPLLRAIKLGEDGTGDEGGMQKEIKFAESLDEPQNGRFLVVRTPLKGHLR